MTGQILKQSGGHMGSVFFKSTLTFLGCRLHSVESVRAANCTAHQMQEWDLPLQLCRSLDSAKNLEGKNMKKFLYFKA